MKIKRALIACFLIAIGQLSIANAQTSTLHDPVSFKLRNGMNIIVAENTGTPKVYSSFTLEDVLTEESPVTQTVLTMMLNDIALDTQAGISFNDKGGNLANSIAGFENALLALSSTVTNADLTEQLLEKTKIALLESVNRRLKFYPATVTAARIEATTLEEIKTCYANNYQPAKACLTIAGNITPAEAKLIAKKAFGEWKENQVANTTTSR